MKARAIKQVGFFSVAMFLFASLSLLSWHLASPDSDSPVVAMGWVDNAAEREPIALKMKAFAATPAYQISTGEMPKSGYLWEAVRKLTGNDSPERDQNPIGSCVSFGTARAIERSLSNELLAKFAVGEYRPVAEEPIYGGSRVEIGGGRIRGDGSIGAWAAQYVTSGKYGVLFKVKYGPIDLSNYDPNRCQSWGRRGVPDELEPIAQKSPVKDAARVMTWAEAKKAIPQGYGIAVCSNQGFVRQRDANGFCRPSGTWQHCMCLDGYHVDEQGREFGHIENSWGAAYHTGPTGWGSPNRAGFWADSATIDRMLRQGDSWAFSGTTGFPSRKIDWDQFGAVEPLPKKKFVFNPDPVFLNRS